MSQGKPNEQRMVADRFRRIWGIVQTIADEPGHTRFDLAGRFNLSERQVQADLNIIRVDMRLPLIRRQGYRFADEAGISITHGYLNIQDLLVLVTVMAAGRDAIEPEQADGLAEKMARLAPLHLRPLAHELFLGQRSEQLRRIALAALATGDDKAIRVLIEIRNGSTTDMLKPDLIVPYLGAWYIVGEDARTGRSRMWCLDQVTMVEPVAIRLGRKTRGAA